MPKEGGALDVGGRSQLHVRSAKELSPSLEFLASDVGEFGDKAVEGRHGDGKPAFCCSTNRGATQGSKIVRKNES